MSQRLDDLARRLTTGATTPHWPGLLGDSLVTGALAAFAGWEHAGAGAGKHPWAAKEG